MLSIRKLFNVGSDKVKLSKFDEKFFKTLSGHEEIAYRKEGKYYTILYDGNKAGIVGFIPGKNKDTVFAQIVIHPDYRGKQILKSAYDLLVKKHKIKILYATIKKNNIASSKSHINAGFKKLDEREMKQLRDLDFLENDEDRYVKLFK